MVDNFAQDLEKIKQDKKVVPLSISVLKDQQNNLIDDLQKLFNYNTRKIPSKYKNIIDTANRLYQKQSSTKDEIVNSIGKLKNAIKEENDKQKVDAEQARKIAEQQAKEEEKALKSPHDIPNDLLQKLAKNPPSPETGLNPFRPRWIHYSQDGKWFVRDNDLANAIVNHFKMFRITQDGKDLGFIQYNKNFGSWKRVSLGDIGLYIDKAFQNPNFNNIDAENNTFAEDLHDSKIVNQVMSLITKSKLRPIDISIFDDVPKYVVHFKNFDFDVLNWKKLSFDSNRHFQYDKTYNPDKDIISLPLISIENSKMSFDSIIPETKKWLTQSLGDTDTFHAFLERLGYSFLQTYEENFFIFIQSEGGQGKSSLFNFLKRNLFNDDEVSALDIDQLADKGSFDASELRYKSINLTSDVKSSFLPNDAVSMLKTISGEDKRNLPQKYSKTANFTNHASLWFNMNGYPRLEKYDDAIARRADLFNWNAIPNFEKEIDMEQVKKEVPKLVAVALIYAHRMLIREPIKYDDFPIPIKLYRSNRMINSYKEWSDKYNYFKHFIKSECIQGKKYKVGAKHLLKKYKEFIKNNEGAKANPTLSTLSDELKHIGINKSENKTSWKDEYGEWKTGVYVFKGITLKGIAGVQDEEYEYQQEIKHKKEKSSFA